MDKKSPPKPEKSSTPPVDPDALAKRQSEAHSQEAIRFADEGLVEWMKAHPDEVVKQRLETLKRLRKKRCNYGQGGILPLTLSPMLLTKKSVDLIRKTIETLDRVVDKIIHAYMRDEDVRKQFAYPEVPEEWIRWDPGYKKPTVISRHDAIYDGKNLKFIEFNCDNPGARAWVDVVEEVYQSIPMYADNLKGHWKPAERRQMKAMMELFLRYWKEFGGSGKPRVGMTSFKMLNDAEADIFRDYLIEHGIDSNFVDSRELEYRNGKVYSGNVRFDLLHLGLRFVFFKRFPQEHQDFYQAVKNRACLTINHFRSHIGSLKENMAFMTDPENHKWFDADEIECIKKHVPWTRRMDQTITLSPEGRDISLVEYALRNRDKVVLKIASGAGGYEVYVGKACDEAKWRSAVESAAGCSWWILQDACEIPEYEIPVLKDGKVVMEKKNVNLNPYVFDGKYAGILSRVSDSKVINVSSGGGIMPVFEVTG